MADIELHRAHDLGLKGARAAADEMALHLGRRFDLRGAWSGDTMNFDRPGLHGTLALTARDLTLRVVLTGFLLKAMKPVLEQAILGELDALFERHAGAPGARAAKPASGKTAKGGRKKGA